MMALTGNPKKTGRLAWESVISPCKFSRLTVAQILLYASAAISPCSMARPAKLPKLKVIWEPVPDPDPEALTKAFAMLFERGPYGPDRRRFDKSRGSANVHDDLDY
jgi:hypothetical protein